MTKGGKRAGAGRPPAPPSAPISIRVTVEQNNAYKAAGGAKWLKALLDKQITKTERNPTSQKEAVEKLRDNIFRDFMSTAGIIRK